MIRITLLAMLALSHVEGLLVPRQDPAVHISENGAQPQLVADQDGTFYCAFISGGNFVVSTSADGLAWSKPVVAIDAKGQARGGMQRGPRIGVDSKKRVFVSAPQCFDEAELKEKYPKAELWLAVSEDGGATFAKPIQVNEISRKAPEALHWLAVSANGTAHVAWLDIRDREKGQDLMYARWADGKLGKNLKIAANICDCCAPGLAADASGNPFAIYREGGKTNRQILLTRSTDGGKSFQPGARVNGADTKIDTCPMDAPAVAVSNDGKKMALAWMDMRAGRNDRKVWWKPSLSAPETQLAVDAQSSGGHPSLDIATDGTVYAAWEEGKGKVQQIMCCGGTVKPQALSIELDGRASFPSLAAGKSVGVAYEANGKILFRTLPKKD